MSRIKPEGSYLNKNSIRRAEFVQICPLETLGYKRMNSEEFRKHQKNSMPTRSSMANRTSVY